MTHTTPPSSLIAPHASRPVLTFLGRLSLIIVGLLFPLLALEIGVRVLGLAPSPEPNPAIWEPHPLFGWWHVPYSGGIFRSDFREFEAEVRINARGLRDRELGYDNPDNAFRVLSLGDSFGEALQVNLEETYHKQLEVLLADSLGKPVEVLNGGVGGWGTDQEAIFYLAEGFRYRPDIVLLAFFVRNDAVNNYGPLEIERNGGSRQKQFFELSSEGELVPPPVEAGVKAEAEDFSRPSLLPQPPSKAPLLGVADTLWRVSALYRFAVPYLRDISPVVRRLGPSGILGGEAIIRANHPATPVPFYVYQTPPDARFEAAWALTEAIIARLRDEVQGRGSRLVVVIIGAPEQVYPAEWEQTVRRNPAMQSLAWDLDGPNRRLNAFLVKEDIPHLDLLPVFRHAASNPATPLLHFRHDQHWTPAGHRLAAEALHKFLVNEVNVKEESTE